MAQRIEFFSFCVLVIRHFPAFLVCSFLASPVIAQGVSSEAPAVNETFRDWVVKCSTTSGDSSAVRICQMGQEMTQQSDGKRILNVTIQRNENGTGITRLTTPLGVALPRGVGIRVEEAELIRFGYLACTVSGCIAQGVLETSVLETLQQGSQGQVSMVNFANGSEVNLNLSLLGFTAAWKRLAELAN